MTDWEEAAFSNRHVHNRSGKQGKGKGRQSGAQFDVRKTFGTYEVKCPAAARLQPQNSDDTSLARFEIFTLNEQGNALFAELHLPGTIHANVLLAGSRKVMNKVVRDLEMEAQAKDDDEEEGQEQADDTSCGDEQEGDEEDDRSERRILEFEKNSFRSPKFWLRWQGELLKPTDENVNHSKVVTDGGYVVFSGNTCDKFQGTFSCEQLDWDNVKINGWKIATKSARDVNFHWSTSCQQP